MCARACCRVCVSPRSSLSWGLCCAARPCRLRVPHLVVPCALLSLLCSRCFAERACFLVHACSLQCVRLSLCFPGSPGVRVRVRCDRASASVSVFVLAGLSVSAPGRGWGHWWHLSISVGLAVGAGTFQSVCLCARVCARVCACSSASVWRVLRLRPSPVPHSSPSFVLCATKNICIFHDS